jgi:hypothetical protein
MKKFIQIEIDPGYLFETPAAVVAAHRASTMLQLHPDSFASLEEAMEDTLGLFDDDLEVVHWVKIHMKWSEIAPYSRIVRYQAPEKDLSNARLSLTDHQALSAALDMGAVMSTPGDALLSALINSGIACSAIDVKDDNGGAFAAFAAMAGPPRLIAAYLQALEEITILHQGPLQEPLHKQPTQAQ